MTSPTPQIQTLIDRLKLQPHPEGGWYRELYRSPILLDTPRGSRSALTTIYYLLAAGQMGRWHVVESDEIWHFYSGQALELVTYDPDQRQLTRHELSSSAGEHVAIVPPGIWQAAKPIGDYALVGCTVGPGFDFNDFAFISDLPNHLDHFKADLVNYQDLL
jgi:uncharacterized protein